MLHAGLDLSRRKLDICLLSDQLSTMLDDPKERVQRLEVAGSGSRSRGCSRIDPPEGRCEWTSTQFASPLERSVTTRDGECC
jgi:hypothetical protein